MRKALTALSRVRIQVNAPGWVAVGMFAGFLISGRGDYAIAVVGFVVINVIGRSLLDVADRQIERDLERYEREHRSHHF